MRQQTTLSRWAAVALFAGTLACGGSPAGPGPRTAEPTVTLLMIHNSAAWLRPGDTETITANARWSDNNPLRGLTSVTWTSSDPSVLTVAPANQTGEQAKLTAVGPGVAAISAAAHGAAQSIAVRVVSVTTPPDAGRSPASASIVINEFRFTGPGGKDDGFIELRNVSGAAVDISGWGIAYSSATGAVQPVGNFPAGSTLGAGCHFYLVSGHPKSVSNEPSLAADFIWAPSLAGDGSLALHDTGGRIQDQTGVGGRYIEGTPLGISAFAQGGSYQRTADTNNNAADFAVGSHASKANRSSPCM